MFEKQGIPTVTVGTDEFAGLLQLEAEQRGLSGLPRVTVPHPLGGLKPAAMQAKAAAAVDALQRALVAGG